MSRIVPLALPSLLLLLAGCETDGAMTEQSTTVQLAKAGKLKVDQSNPAADPEGLGICNGLYGQIFVPQAKNVARVDLLLTVNQIGAGGDATTVGVYTDITEPALASTSVTVDPPQPGELSRVISYSFEPAVPIQKGSTYIIGWSGTTSCWQFSRGDPYPNGNMVLFDGTPLADDFWFVTYSN